MTPSELEGLKKKLAEEFSKEKAGIPCQLRISGFEAGWEAALEIGKLLGRKEAFEEAGKIITTDYDFKKNQAETDFLAAVFSGREYQANCALAALTRKENGKT